jgi:hypothetical protein
MFPEDLGLGERAHRTELSIAQDIRHDSRGWLGSFALHALFVCFIFAIARPHAIAPYAPVPIPADIVQLGNETSSPPLQHHALSPQQKSAIPARPRLHTAAPKRMKPAAASDGVEARIRALAKLREADTTLPPLNGAGVSNTDIATDASDNDGSYSVKDYIRNQVERRWNINLQRIGNRREVVLLRVAVKADGTVTRAEIVDTTRFANDPVWRDFALSARNAALLSSPINLPSGQRVGPVDVILRLEPRDLLR